MPNLLGMREYLTLALLVRTPGDFATGMTDLYIKK